MSVEQSIARRTVCIESPLRGKDAAEYARNRDYALAALLHAIDHGVTPYAPHILIPLVLDDKRAVDRDLGIECGLDMGDRLDERWFYVDFGMSYGMQLACDRCAGLQQPVRSITLGADWEHNPAYKPRPTHL